jgi:hypothetical protein
MTLPDFVTRLELELRLRAVASSSITKIAVTWPRAGRNWPP